MLLSTIKIYFKRLVSKMDNHFYPAHSNNWDSKLFRDNVLLYLKKDYIILDLGAGSGILPEMDFRQFVKKVIGVDPDNVVLNNPLVDEAQVACGEEIPYTDSFFDIIVSNNVLEHIEQPEIFFCEVKRVLKRGGIFLFKTPNKNHYVPFFASLTPHSFHIFFNKLRGRNENDTFPTYYRVNTKKDLEYYAALSGLEIMDIKFVEGRPEYLRFNPLTYFFGIIYEKLVNNLPVLWRFRIHNT